MPIAVIDRPLVGVREDCISLAHLLELILGIWIIRIPVGMELQGKLSVSALQFLFGHRAGNAQDLVVIAFCVRGQKMAFQLKRIDWCALLNWLTWVLSLWRPEFPPALKPGSAIANSWHN